MHISSKSYALLVSLVISLSCCTLLNAMKKKHTVKRAVGNELEEFASNHQYKNFMRDFRREQRKIGDAEKRGKKYTPDPKYLTSQQKKELEEKTFDPSILEKFEIFYDTHWNLHEHARLVHAIQDTSKAFRPEEQNYVQEQLAKIIRCRFDAELRNRSYDFLLSIEYHLSDFGFTGAEYQFARNTLSAARASR